VLKLDRYLYKYPSISDHLDEIIFLCTKEGLSVREISKGLDSNVHHAVIQRILKMLGLLRSKAET